ncbi:MAG TPA: CHAT domain-containing tetratricopeptide repeat protein [Thermoanaerobaculia bacterium]|nr:CHAT domain-containing tetratricopeptide repeat protein [Thermoanaerobaculia bacterium]
MRVLTLGCSLGCSLSLFAAALCAQTLDDARALHAAGRLDEALAAYRVVARSLQGSDPASAASARNNACAILNDRGDYRAALAECQESLRLFQGIDDPLRLSRALNNTGLSLQYLGRWDEAEQRFREALAINRRTGDVEAQVINLANLGLSETSAGRYGRALAFHAEAARLAAAHAGEPWAPVQLRVARINQGVVLEKLGAYQEALALYRQVLAEGDALEPGQRATLEVDTGVVYRNLGDPVRALEEFRQAVAIFEGEGDAGDVAALSNAWLNIGLVHHLNLESPRAAEEAYRKALHYAEASGDRSEEIQDLFYLGRLLLGRGRLGEAERVFRRCLAAAERSGSAEGRWSALDGLGRIAAARGRHQDALAAFERAMTEIEAVRSSLPRRSLRFHFFGERRPVYAAAVEVLADLEARQPGAGHAARALEVVQRAKVRELLDALGRAGGAKPLTAADLRRRAGDGVLLEYFLGERRLFLWTVSGGGLRMKDLGPSAPILGKAAEVHRELSRGGVPAGPALAALSRALLGPAGRLPEGSRELRIAPDGALRYLPFEILEAPGDPGPPLVSRVRTSYLPSGSAMAWLGHGEDRPALTLLGFGGPEIPARREGLTGAAVLEARYRLPPLPATVRELESAARRLPGRTELRLGRDATEAAFRQSMKSGTRILHLATHTVIDERPGAGTAILLTPAGDDDGLLSPAEIAGLEGSADLTVLAACSTALAPDAGSGDALATLTGSFLAAGSPAVVATLWDVGDDATAVFMEQLYHQLGRGHTPAEALRRAKERLRADPRWQSPALWAGYVLVGEAPAVVRRPLAWLGIWIAAALAAAGLAWILFRRRVRES